MSAGTDNIARAADLLAARVPEPLAGLARLAYNYRWSWTPGGPEAFQAIDPDRWERCGENPVRLLQEADPALVERAAADAALHERIAAVQAAVDADLARPDAEAPSVAYFCAEFGVHRSLPVYSGGLGALAGDILKESSDLALPLVAVGLMYRQGYFRQRIDAGGWQHEYWVDTDPEHLPAALVRGDDGEPLTITVPIRDMDVVAQVWRVDVGRVALYLLDTERPENPYIARWITSRLYIGDPDARLSQYVLLGAGGVRALAAMGLEPAEVIRLGRTRPDDEGEEFGVSQFALRTSRAANGVSRRHGEVARGMWKDLWPGKAVEDVPIGHVTNGVHVPTWLGGPMRALLDRHLGDRWLTRAADPATWAPVREIPDEELWAVRGEQRAAFVDYVRAKSTVDRLGREDPRVYAEAAARAFEPETLTIGFARRLATYKRLHLLVQDSEQALKMLSGDRPVQLVIAGKAHPRDEAGKRLVQHLFTFKWAPEVGGRVVYLDDYDLSSAARMVRGCDVWVNLPRPPLEASGTSGMKSAVNGGLQLSVLDGWWAEGYDGTNGWALSGDEHDDHGAQDQRDGAELHRLLEHEVAREFYDRDADGLPRAWLARVKRSLATNGPEFSATRMVQDYVQQFYKRA